MQIIYEPKLSERTSIRLGGKAIAELCLTEFEDIYLLPPLIKELGGTVYVIGAGSNILASDEDLPLLLLKPAFAFSPKLLQVNENTFEVEVGAGVALPKLLAFCAKNGLTGLEPLSGIPGAVGGAIAMNAGSFGTQTCEHLKSVTIYSDATGIVNMSREDFSYGYREFSLIKKDKIIKWFFIIQATFILTHEEMNGITKTRTREYFKRKSTQPINVWSAGCVFKNPTPDKPAGKLLEECGFRGKKLGKMEFSAKHANFLVNTGEGRSADAFYLMEEAKEKVQDTFGLALQTEVKILCP